MAAINWALGRADPNAQARGFSYADMIAKAAGQQAAGQAFASGDYKGAEAALAQSGDIGGALKLQTVQQQQQDAQAKRAQAAYSYIGQALPLFRHIAQVHADDPDGGGAAIGQAFDRLAPEISQLTGHDGQALAVLRQNLVSDPEGTLSRIQAMLPAQYKTVGPGQTYGRMQGGQFTPIYTAPNKPNIPAGYEVGPDGQTLSFIPGGPADPAVIKRNAVGRREVIINNPLPSQTATSVDVSTPVDENSKDIAAQIGTTMPVFYALTGQVQRLGRGHSRDMYLREAGQVARRLGSDPSTLASEYEAYNSVLKSNIQRVNQTRIMEQEMLGTIENLKPVADAAHLGNLNVGNVMRLLTGKEFNDPIVQQYRFQLEQLQSELAAYNAALQGRSGNGITETDRNEANNIIRNGLNSNAADGLAKAVNAATSKMGRVLDNNVRTARRAVWSLFGLGKQFDKVNPKPKETASDGVKKSGRFTIEAVQ